MAKLGDMIDYLKKNSVRYEVIEHAPAYTAHEAAIASHVPDKDLAKTLIVQSDDKYCMVVMPADHRLDEHLLGKTIKAKQLHLAQEEDLKPLFPDCELGAMPPLGNIYHLDVWVDSALQLHYEICFNAGTHAETIQMTFSDFSRLVQPRTGSFGVLLH